MTARDKLKAVGIPTEMKSVRNRGGFDMMGEAIVHARYNLPAGTASTGIAFSYTLYVRRKDYQRAKDLLKI